MTLSLTMLRCPNSVPPQSRTVDGGEFAIGRGPENDWVLPDPERYLSKRHCVLALRSGVWRIIDYSTNGTFVNRDRTPIGRGQARELSDGDRLHMGAYEIEIRVLEEGQPKRSTAKPSPALDLEPLPEIAERMPGLDSLLQTRTAVEPLSATRTMPSIKLPADYDPLAPDPDIDGGLLGPVQRVLLPEDWNLESDLASALKPGGGPEHAARAERTESRGNEALAAFFKGAGLDAELPADPVAAMAALGAVFREMIHGLRQAIIARGELKAKFRIEQTNLRARGNNPLKFSADDKDALGALVASARHGDKTAVEAVADALNDIRLHELVTIDAMQQAAAELLAELDPEKLRDIAGDGGFNLVSAQRKARSWDAFETQYEQLKKSLADGFDSAFGKAFARAYEGAIAAAVAKEHR